MMAQARGTSPAGMMVGMLAEARTWALYFPWWPAAKWIAVGLVLLIILWLVWGRR